MPLYHALSCTAYYPIYTLCNHCLSLCDTTLWLCRYLLWTTVHEVMVPVRFPRVTLLQTHDTLTFNLPGNNCGRSGQILQLYLENTKQPSYTDTTREREQLGFKILISTTFSTCKTLATPFNPLGGDF